MKKLLVKEIMVPLGEYATIHQDATLREAVLALEKAQEEYCRPGLQYPHRAILVYGDSGKIVGKLSQLDILRCLEPKYRMAAGEGRLRISGVSSEFLRSVVKQYALWDKPLEAVCKKATDLKVKACMYIPEPGEFISAGDTLDMAVHQLVMGHHQSLLVVEKDEIVGILRLTDVFREIADAVKSCKV